MRGYNLQIRVRRMSNKYFIDKSYFTKIIQVGTRRRKQEFVMTRKPFEAQKIGGLECSQVQISNSQS